MAKAENNESATGVVFILENPAMPNFIKVGHTVNFDERLKELDRCAAMPFPFTARYAAEVENPGAWMRMVREVFDGAKVSTCFFNAEVADGIEGVFKLAKGKEVKPAATRKGRGKTRGTKTETPAVDKEDEEG